MDNILSLLSILGLVAVLLTYDKWQQKKSTGKPAKALNGSEETTKKTGAKRAYFLNLMLILLAVGAVILFFAGIVLLWWIWLPIMGFFVLLKLLAR